MLVGVLTKSTTLFIGTFANVGKLCDLAKSFELICDCVLKELRNECFLIFGVSKTLTMCLT